MTCEPMIVLSEGHQSRDSTSPDFGTVGGSAGLSFNSWLGFNFPFLKKFAFDCPPASLIYSFIVYISGGHLYVIKCTLFKCKGLFN